VPRGINRSGNLPLTVGFDLGSLIGGFVGAAGAVGAVYFLIRQQRREEANNVSHAIRREIIVLSEILISQLRILEAIKSGEVTIMRNKLRSAIMNPDTIIYKAVANRIGLLPYPVVQFYMRMVEIQNAVQIAVVGPGGENVAVPGGEAETIAKSVTIACNLARVIISHPASPSVDEEIGRVTLVHIDEALERAKQSFPQTPTLLRDEAQHSALNRSAG
jgi:hypothetical protein